jgi:hypothetical protein
LWLLTTEGLVLLGASSVTNSLIEGALTAGESATAAGLIFAAAGLEKKSIKHCQKSSTQTKKSSKH